MKFHTIALLWSFVLCASVAGQELSVESKVAPKPNQLAVPRLVKAKLSLVGVQHKFVLMLPAYRADMPTRLRPTLFDLDRFKFYDVDGKLLSADDVAALTPNMTSIFLIEGFDGEFAGFRSTASLAGGGLVYVVTATQSNQEIKSGGAIATANGLGLENGMGLETRFPSTHSGNDSHGWLGRDDLNRGFADPDRFGWLHYDLGTSQKLCGLRIWNYNFEELIQRAVRDIDVYVSSDAAAMGQNDHPSWQKVADFDDIPPGPGHSKNEPYGSDYSLTKPTSARYVRLDVQRNWGNGFNTALAEVQFFALPDKSVFAVTVDEVVEGSSGDRKIELK